ncbi:hypothetical protein [Streptomyces sp. NPDC049879]|uniref:hypothetical protein n=1 Tax=Streptomyces sp. NPDC049879 TaxID=3365598 RepID=UPI00378783F5
MKIRFEDEEVPLGAVLRGAVQAVRDFRRIGRQTRALTAEGSPALRAELGAHFAGWITVQVRAATGGATDLSGARDLDGLVQRVHVARALLDEPHPDRATLDTIAHYLGQAVKCSRSSDKVIRGWVVRDLARAVQAARIGAARQEETVIT